MIKELSESKGPTVGIEISGKVDIGEEHRWIATLNGRIREYGYINLLVVFDGWVNFGVDVVYEDLKWIFKHLRDINKIAVASNSKVLGWLVTIDSPFGKLVGIREKHFELSQLQDAWHWIED